MAPKASDRARRTRGNRKKPQRPPGTKARPPHPGEAERIVERRLSVWQLRKTGASYREIGKALKIDASTVCRDIAAHTDETKRLTAEAREEERQRTLEQVDDLYRWLLPKARKGDAKAATAMLRALERRAKLLGLDAPMRVQPVAAERPFEALDDAALAAQVTQARAVVDAAP